MPKRHCYTKRELLSRRSDPISRRWPIGLKSIEGVTELLINPSTPAFSNKGIKDSSKSLDNPPFQNRTDDPYKPADRDKIDSDENFRRQFLSILNKLTPQTYDKLLEKLDKLELDRFERLEAMIVIIFSKAVNETAFCTLYAHLCKHFKKKQVSIPDQNGQLVTRSFQQLLLTRCQKEFENDYRQEINCEKRTAEIEAITNEKIQKEEVEKLEEDLARARRKKLGNIL